MAVAFYLDAPGTWVEQHQHTLWFSAQNLFPEVDAVQLHWRVKEARPTVWLSLSVENLAIEFDPAFGGSLKDITDYFLRCRSVLTAAVGSRSAAPAAPFIVHRREAA